MLYFEQAGRAAAVVDDELNLVVACLVKTGRYRPGNINGVRCAAGKDPARGSAGRHARGGHLDALARADEGIGQHDCRSRFFLADGRRRQESGELRHGYIIQAESEPFLQADGSGLERYGLAAEGFGLGAAGRGVEAQVVGFEDEALATDLGQGGEHLANAQQVFCRIGSQGEQAFHAPVAGQAMRPANRAIVIQSCQQAEGASTGAGTSGEQPRTRGRRQ